MRSRNLYDEDVIGLQSKRGRCHGMSVVQIPRAIDRLTVRPLVLGVSLHDVQPDSML